MDVKDLNKLTKKELVHLLFWVIGEDIIYSQFEMTRRIQEEREYPCPLCESVERKLKGGK